MPKRKWVEEVDAEEAKEEETKVEQDGATLSVVRMAGCVEAFDDAALDRLLRVCGAADGVAKAGVVWALREEAGVRSFSGRGWVHFTSADAADAFRTCDALGTRAAEGQRANGGSPLMLQPAPLSAVRDVMSILCLRCQKEGHFARDCKSAAAAEARVQWFAACVAKARQRAAEKRRRL
eukprot:TRINITY_DN36500_c0_g1_i1.p3 TRINITY_DN36500_c0_g1~~TRINITY_DN36500_c0_g1_i1.p3  ORF type:complete len:179 (+),score=75.06 TRINITY_DN36500_c0_g1_i1:48-584(+)